MKTSLSFLGLDIAQLPKPGMYGNDGVEAVSFNRSDLEADNWKQVWRNVEVATKLYSPSRVTYHFPMNDSDYVAESNVAHKLGEALRRATDLGLRGVVVHSNRIQTYQAWQGGNFEEERQRVLTVLANTLAKHANQNTWLGLENMPLVGNSGYDTDPLFCFSSDFENLPAGLQVTWDICHHLSTLAYLNADAHGELQTSLILRSQAVAAEDFATIAPKIAHWHFAGFTGLNDPARNTVCTEGVLPDASQDGQPVYASLLRFIEQHSRNDAVINFEVQETDYTDRQVGPAIIAWAKQIS